eukprot:TRINITY_DN53221_c0_g1_i1.p1 TRINITY_DN53221_c0_g1~~TRINITY_DN53221_c0_g1_i1.p1  ORF type:complete len:204 (-),score=34.95 TRINITY_DN53221_c0_g1_i1:79-690(-)
MGLFSLRTVRLLSAFLSVAFAKEAYINVEELGAAIKDLKDIDGNPIPSDDIIGGGVTLITNIASACGYTEVNYEQLTQLSKEYEQLRIIGFPCNQFGAQEPGSPEEIKAFAQKYFDKHGSKWRLAHKTNVNGPHTNPLWRLLKEKLGGGDIEWNFFTKFLLWCSGKECKAARFDGKNPFDLRGVIMLALNSHAESTSSKKSEL